MKDEARTKEQLIAELAGLRRRIAEMEVAVSERREGARSSDRQNAASETPKPTPRILIAEDETIVAADLERMLMGQGYDSAGTFASGEEVLRGTEEARPDLVLMDIKLRGELNGIETAARIRERYGIPVVYLASYTEEMVLQRAKTADPFGCVGKPVRERELRAIIEMALYRHEMDMKLRESEERYRAISALASDWAYSLRVDQDGDIELEWVTEAFNRTMASFDPPVRPGDLLELVHPDDAPLMKKRLERLLSGETDISEYRMKTGDGGWRWICDFARPEWDEGQNRIVRFRGTTQDITERKQAEEAWRESERRLKRIIENMPVLFDAFDEDGVALCWNKECERVTGYSADEIVGNPDSMELLVPDPTYRAWILEQLQELGHDYRDWELELRCKDGETRTIAWSNISRDHPVPGWWSWGVGVDVTERKRAEERSRANLAEKEVLLQEIHHRVKNNLQVISSLLSFQSDTLENEEAARAFQESQNRVHSMASVHEHLYRSEDLAQIDMEHYIVELVDHLRQSYWAYGVIPKVEVADATLDVDTAILCGLLVTELVSNAMEHAFPTQEEVGPDTPRGEIHVTLCPVGEEFEMTVSDDGAGLPEDVDIETTTSLGLRLVDMLARQLRGTLEVDRGGEKGTAFKVTFPAP